MPRTPGSCGLLSVRGHSSALMKMEPEGGVESSERVCCDWCLCPHLGCWNHGCSGNRQSLPAWWHQNKQRATATVGEGLPWQLLLPCKQALPVAAVIHSQCDVSCYSNIVCVIPAGDLEGNLYSAFAYRESRIYLSHRGSQGYGAVGHIEGKCQIARPPPPRILQAFLGEHGQEACFWSWLHH